MKFGLKRKSLAMIISTIITGVLHFLNPELLQIIMDAGTFAGVLILILVE
jgi:hypothetical protein